MQTKKQSIKYLAWLRLPRVFFEIIKYKIAVRLVRWRNLPKKILKHPHPKLKRISDPVDFQKMSYRKIFSIFKTMQASLMDQPTGDHLGIAAPQIGINKRMIIVNGVPMINPSWKPTDAPLEIVYEGCYSLRVNDVYKVKRAKYGWATWQDMNGHTKKYQIKGIQAIIFQHELSHLDGKCCNELGTLVEVPEKLPIKK